MEKPSTNGVDVTVATPEQLATYAVAEHQLNAFEVPRLYTSSDPNSRVFFALFDGTGNDAIKDPKNLTNVGLLKNQVDLLADKNPNIAGFYKEGPGTQDNKLFRLVDGAIGGTYHERIEAMYDQFSRQSERWLKENPDAKISVVSVGFSRGAEQAAGFSRVVDERGIQDAKSKVLVPAFNGEEQKVSYMVPPLRDSRTVPQALALYDPVGTGEPARNDRRPPPSVLSGVQITAADELRTVFPSSAIIPQGVSTDGRFIGVTTAGAHSNIGGSYELNGLSHRNFNLMATYLNRTLGEPLIKQVNVPVEPERNVIHDSTQHLFIYRRASEREVIQHCSGPGPRKEIEPVDPALALQYLQKNRAQHQENSNLRTATPAVVQEVAFPVSPATVKPVGTSMPAAEWAEARQYLGKLTNVPPVTPKTNLEYAGKILYANDTHMVQQAGKTSVVVHDLAKLGNARDLLHLYDNGALANKTVKIKYDNEQGFGKLVSMTPERAGEIKKEASKWGMESIHNPTSRAVFLKHAENSMQAVAKSPRREQAVKPPEAPLPSRSQPPDKGR